MRGLGDLIDYVTNVTGIKSIFDSFGDCGCDERHAKLNEAFPFVGSVKMNGEQKGRFELLLPFISGEIHHKKMQECIDLHNQLFGTKTKICNCPKKMKSIIQKLTIVYQKSCDINSIK